MNIYLTLEELDLIITLLHEEDCEEAKKLHEKLVKLAPARPENE